MSGSGSGGSLGCPAVVVSPSLIFASGRETLPDVREWSAGPPRYAGVVGRPSRMSGVVGTPARMSGSCRETTRISGSGREAHPNV